VGGGPGGGHWTSRRHPLAPVPATTAAPTGEARCEFQRRRPAGTGSRAPAHEFHVVGSDGKFKILQSLRGS
jgi:hypothetical protein